MSTKRTIIAVLASALCGWGIWQASRIGYARTLEEYAAKARRDNVAELVRKIARVSDSQDAADRAVALLPADAESHSARATVLQFFEDYPQARDEFARAVHLRPRNYYLWMLLGINRDLSQDPEGALRALRQAAVLAPTYAQVRWQLGNLLLRMGQLDQAFTELRRAAMSNPTLWPNVIDLAWGIYGHDPGAVITVLQPETDTPRMALALFFAHHNQGAAALEQFRQFRSTGTASDKNTKSLLDELLKSGALTQAYEVWVRVHGLPSANATGAVLDGGFEDAIDLRQSGFGWQVTPNIANVTMSVDEGEHHSGGRSLRVDFRGNSEPGAPLLTQLVLVKPQTHYVVSFAALSREFVSAALPLVTISDAADPKIVLAQSPPLGTDANSWREFSLDFNTNAQAQAIMIAVARQRCPNNPCPAFGTLWLDSFSVSPH